MAMLTRTCIIRFLRSPITVPTSPTSERIPRTASTRSKPISSISRGSGRNGDCASAARRANARSPNTPPNEEQSTLLRHSKRRGRDLSNECLWRPDMWGIIPAAGRGSRIQPLAFSKELLPVGSRVDNGIERPCAVSEYLLERMILGGADRICFIISPGKSDILEYLGDAYGGANVGYVVQPNASGLCD